MRPRIQIRCNQILPKPPNGSKSVELLPRHGVVYLARAPEPGDSLDTKAACTAAGRICQRVSFEAELALSNRVTKFERVEFFKLT